MCRKTQTNKLSLYSVLGQVITNTNTGTGHFGPGGSGMGIATGSGSSGMITGHSNGKLSLCIRNNGFNLK